MEKLSSAFNAHIGHITLTGMKHCPICHITVAPQDPDKVVRDDMSYHGHCWRTRGKQGTLPLRFTF